MKLSKLIVKTKSKNYPIYFGNDLVGSSGKFIKMNLPGVKKICIMTSVKFENLVKISKERKGKDQAYLLNTSKIRKRLKWKDKVTLENGMKKTLNWVDDKLNYLKKVPREYKHKI